MPVVAVVAPPVVAVVVLGLLWPRMHGRGALSALLAGWAGGLVQMTINPGSVAQILESVILTFVLSALVFVLVSLMVAPLGALRKVQGTILQVRKP
jgi:SSS family solute:Na+ symporter